MIEIERLDEHTEEKCAGCRKDAQLKIEIATHRLSEAAIKVPLCNSCVEALARLCGLVLHGQVLAMSHSKQQHGR